MTTSEFNPKPSELSSRVYGCWLGKSVGGTLGLPAEGRMERLHFSFYDPVPTIAPPNDDLELQLVWLHLVEQLAGNALTQDDLARGWLEHIHYMWDEYGRCRWNLRRGVPASAAGTFENHFVSGMGSPIRSEFWACLFPGDPASAAYYGALDASLDHGVEGIAGEVLFAAMQAEVLGGKSVVDAIESALKAIPAQSQTAAAIALVFEERARGSDAWAAWERLLAQHGNENFTHAPLNVALTIWALLYGEGDFEKSILLAVNGGYDTDCTAATVGATVGMAIGAEGIPARWVEPIGNGVFIGQGIQGIDAAATLEDLTARTLALLGKLERKPWAALDWAAFGKAATLAPESLAGTIKLTPLGSDKAVAWANGELPSAVKTAGGASWQWQSTDGQPRYMIALARGGARLFVDGDLVVDCPQGLDYVPATHRCAEGARQLFRPQAGQRYTVHLELGSTDPSQDASVILAYPNLHIAPWTAGELPHPAKLQATA